MKQRASAHDDDEAVVQCGEFVPGQDTMSLADECIMSKLSRNGKIIGNALGANQIGDASAFLINKPANPPAIVILAGNSTSLELHDGECYLYPVLTRID